MNANAYTRQKKTAMSFLFRDEVFPGSESLQFVENPVVSVKSHITFVVHFGLSWGRHALEKATIDAGFCIFSLKCACEE